jgi:hypothetical protein
MDLKYKIYRWIQMINHRTIILKNIGFNIKILKFVKNTLYILHDILSQFINQEQPDINIKYIHHIVEHCDLMLHQFFLSVSVQCCITNLLTESKITQILKNKIKQNINNGLEQNLKFERYILIVLKPFLN